jgi:hypothetical protein
MKETIKKCLEQHLVDKAKTRGSIVPAEVWLDSTDKHIASAKTIINSDPVGSLVLSWLAMHNIAKAAAASIGAELVEETHGKVADFLACIFSADLTDEEAGLIQTIRGGRNAMIYGNPAMPQSALIGRAANLATKLRSLAAAL